jgi:hypothetical protein
MKGGPLTGSRHAVFVAGIKYPSVFSAGIETEIAPTYISHLLKGKKGFPIFIRGVAIVEERWVDLRAAAIAGAQNER